MNRRKMQLLHPVLPVPASRPIVKIMKRIALAALALSLSSCQTAIESNAPKDYNPRADADIAKYTIANNDAYGFEPEGKFDPSTVTILESHKDQDWTVYKVPDKNSGFDSVELTVDGSGTIIRLRFFRVAHTAVGRREIVNTAYQDLKSKYKAVQRIGDLDTADLTVYVAANETEWKKHYVEFLQLMDEPNHLGAQNCWILQPHLSQIQAIVRRFGQGSTLVIDFQTKAYALAIESRTPPPKPSQPED